MLTVTAALESIAVTPANPSVPKGETEQFVATGTLTDGSTENLTSQVAWAAASPSVASITAAGLATGVAAGTSTITASLHGITGSTGLTVSAAVLQSIAVTPASPSIAAGLTKQFTAVGTYSDRSTQTLTTQVTWTSATTSAATISNASGSQGLATGVATGTSTITAALGGITGSIVLTVTAAVLQSIAVTPANPSVAAGLTEQLTAVGTYSDKSTRSLTTQVTWASSAPSVASVTTTGLAMGVAPGSSEIVAAFHGVTGSTVLNVTAPPSPPLVTLVSVSVTLKKRTITQIVVTFSGAVNNAEAQSIGEYRLATPGKKGSFTAKNAGIIKLKKAVYDQVNDTVVLTPRKPFGLTEPVQLSINGTATAGLQDSFGRLIDGDHNGGPGGNAVAVIRKAGVTVSARALARSSQTTRLSGSLVDIVLDQG
jgi:hypothetical protein